MNYYLTSFLIYAVTANLVAALIFVAGKKRNVHWHAFEYSLIYLPWVGYLILVMFVFGGLEVIPEKPVLKGFLLVMQSLASGLMGGLILLPKAFVSSSSHRLRKFVTLISAVVITILYIQFRFALFMVVKSLV